MRRLQGWNRAAKFKAEWRRLPRTVENTRGVPSGVYWYLLHERLFQKHAGKAARLCSICRLPQCKHTPRPAAVTDVKPPTFCHWVQSWGERGSHRPRRRQRNAVSHESYMTQEGGCPCVRGRTCAACRLTPACVPPLRAPRLSSTADLPVSPAPAAVPRVLAPPGPWQVAACLRKRAA